MAGKVFISCGQRSPKEKRMACDISKLLKDKFNLTPYLAFTIQSLDDIMTITKELRSSDYYLFVDFLRDSNSSQGLPCSLFTHQELALAHHLGFQNIIALQQKGAPQEGFLRYVLSNPEIFDDEKDLLNKVERLVKERCWTPDYSRNLVVSQLIPPETGMIGYRDHTGGFLRRVWHARIENRRPDVAAMGTVCILDYIIRDDATRIESPDRSYLKWSGQLGYERTILPTDFADVDLFSVQADKPGLFLHSSRDMRRDPILSENGNYQLFFKLYSIGFPLVEFSVKLNLYCSSFMDDMITGAKTAREETKATLVT